MFSDSYVSVLDTFLSVHNVLKSCQGLPGISLLVYLRGKFFFFSLPNVLFVDKLSEVNFFLSYCRNDKMIFFKEEKAIHYLFFFDPTNDMPYLQDMPNNIGDIYLYQTREQFTSYCMLFSTISSLPSIGD